MSTRIDYSAAEWTAISSAPTAAWLVFGRFDVRGSFAAAERTTLVRWPIRPSAPVDAPEIVREVAERTRSTAHVTELGNPGSRAGHDSNALIATVRFAVRTLEARSPEEAEAFKAWLASIAAKAFHAANREPHNGRDRETLARLAEILASPTGHRANGARRARDCVA